MEAYINRLPNETFEVVAVAYDSEGTRIEYRFFMEETGNGGVDLITCRDYVPKRVSCGKVTWVSMVPKREEEVEEGG